MVALMHASYNITIYIILHKIFSFLTTRQMILLNALTKLKLMNRTKTANASYRIIISATNTSQPAESFAVIHCRYLLQSPIRDTTFAVTIRAISPQICEILNRLCHNAIYLELELTNATVLRTISTTPCQYFTIAVPGSAESTRLSDKPCIFTQSQSLLALAYQASHAYSRVYFLLLFLRII